MKKILSLILSIVIFGSITNFAFANDIDKLTLSEYLQVSKDDASNVSITYTQTPNVGWSISGDNIKNFYDIADNIILMKQDKKDYVLNDGYFITVSSNDSIVNNSAFINTQGDVDNFKIMMSSYTRATYRVENYDYAKKELDRLCSTQSTGYYVNIFDQEKVVETSDWAKQSFDTANNSNILPEYMKMGDLTQNITREQFCDLAYKSLEQLNSISQTQENYSFNDTNNSNVLKLCSMGVIKGKSDTTFAPNDLLTREEAVTILNRMAGILNLQIPQTNGEFADNNEISEWARDAAKNMQALEIMQGVGENKFSPKTNYTIEQAIATMLRMYQAVKNI